MSRLGQGGGMRTGGLRIKENSQLQTQSGRNIDKELTPKVLLQELAARGHKCSMKRGKYGNCL